MKVNGTVSSIVFYNSTNGYSVITVTTDSGDLTCVGNLPVLSLGESVLLEGDIVEHARYGRQLLINTFHVLAPKTKEAVVKYLGSGLIKGVGEITARKMYECFGEDTIDIIEKSPNRLTEVKGISPSKAQSITQGYHAVRDMQEQIIFLQEYGITVNTAVKIYNCYGSKTGEIVKENPYKLIDDVDGIGFISADRIAQRMGIASDSAFRIRASVIYLLKEGAEKQGNTFAYVAELTEAAQRLLGLDIASYTQLFEDTLVRLTLDGAVKTFNVEQRQCISLDRYYNTEKYVASKLIKLHYECTQVDLDTSALIDEFERIENIRFHPSQRDAISTAVNQGVTVITGGPGTGKTTIVKCISHIFASQGKQVELCAPTGRAGKRLAMATGFDAKTIHRMLGVTFTQGRLNFTYDQYNPLPCDVVIVDEVSMVDCNIMHSLLRALSGNTRLVLVGDKDQLPSVGAGNVLADIIASKIIPVMYLTHIYRQSTDSLIVTNAHLVNSCKMPVVNNSGKDFFVINKQSGEECLSETIQLVSTRLPSYTKTQSDQIQVLGALKSGVCGVYNCNKELQNVLNPPMRTKREIKVGDTLFREGDKVMQTVNDYEIAWTKRTDSGSIECGEGIFNGDIGRITEIDRACGVVRVMFDDDRLADYSALNIVNLSLAYAVTIHKSQGSEFDVVVIPLIAGAPTILNKNLLYTAITRAKKTVVLICNKRVLSMVVHNNYIAQRNTLLMSFMEQERDKYKSFYDEDNTKD